MAYAQPIPPQIAGAINGFVGDNDVGSGDELTQIMLGTQNKLWSNFFDQALKPAALKGKNSCFCNAEKFFPDLNINEITEMAKRKKVTVEGRYKDQLTFSWAKSAQ